MQLTERDREIIRHVHRHRFLRSSHIVSLLGSSPQQVLRRLQLLFHHGYLERPRAQIDYYHQGGSRHIAYGLGDKGAALLKEEGVVFRQLRWDGKDRSVHRIFLEHELLVSDVMVAIELACRKSGIQFLAGDQLQLPAQLDQKRQPFRWRVNIPGGVKLGIVPDRVFALDYADKADERTRAFFFLEADRGTMPVTRGNLAQTSFFRKLLAYEAAWSQGIHRTRFGFNRFRVLTVTTSAARINSLIDACSRLKSGQGLFLFADWKSLEKADDIFSLPWQTGRQGETACLLP
jgi:DNA-binding Lrp family transcriptional regulator